MASGLRAEYCLQVVGEVALRPAGNANPALASGDIEVHRDRGRGAQCVRAAAVPDRRARRGGRGGAAAVPLSGPAPARPRRGDAAAQRGQPGGPRGAARASVRRGGDPDADPLDPRGRPGLPGAGPAPAGQLVRPAAESAAVQAAAHGRRARALLPDRAVLSGRGLPGRPPARVHPARHRDVVRGAGRRHRPRRGDRRRAVADWSGTRSRCRSRGSPTPRRWRATARTNPICVSASSSWTAPSISPPRRSGCSRLRTSVPS